jgi:hypothetical protein
VNQDLAAENVRLTKLVKQQRNQLRGMNRAIQRYEQIIGALVRLDRLYAVEGQIKVLGSHVHSIGIRMHDLAPPAVRRSWLGQRFFTLSRWSRRWSDRQPSPTGER